MTYSFDDFGGEKTDYDELEDASKDRTADEINKCFAQVAEVGYVTPDVVVVIKCNEFGTFVITGVKSKYTNITASTTTVAAVSIGHYNITLPATKTSQMGAVSTTSVTNAVSFHNGVKEATYFRNRSIAFNSNVVNLTVFNTYVTDGYLSDIDAYSLVNEAITVFIYL